MKVHGISSQIIIPSGYNKLRQKIPDKQIFQSPYNILPDKTNFKVQEGSQITCAYLNAQVINFGYKSILKDLFKQGEMPSVTRGLYGNIIDKSTVSIDHLLPHSLGGSDTLSNYALAHVQANVARGNSPLPYFLDKEMLEKYLSQFNFIIKGKFNGYVYQDMIRRTCKELGVGAKRLEIIDLVTVDKMYNSPCIDLGNMKEVIAHINEIDLNDLPKKMLKSLRNRGYI